jgi:hydroxyacylglutathione hydrolase
MKEEVQREKEDERFCILPSRFPGYLLVMAISLEDSVTDITGKAQCGLGLTYTELSDKIGIEIGEVDAVEKVKGMAYAEVEKMAQALNLGPHSLFAIAEGKYAPTVTPPKTGFFQSTTTYGDMTVNAYLVWDESTKLAAAFDTGADAMILIDEIKKRGLTLQDVYLTHTHVDHVVELDRLLEKAGGSVGVHVNEAEPLDGAATFKPGVTFSLGKLHIESRETSGHSPGGTTYHVHGLDVPLAIVGDALFAGSVGGIKVDYKGSLQKIRDNILSGQDNTILAPGHGPLTTVIQEKQSNPFFPEFRKALAEDI